MLSSAEKHSTDNGERTRDGTLSEKYRCVEMKPVKALPIYQFKLYRKPDDRGAFLFVKPESKIIEHLRADRVLDMKYIPRGDDCRLRSFPTQISSISREDEGPFKGHYRVGISIAREQ